jgi:flagellar biosynthesis protein FlhF
MNETMTAEAGLRTYRGATIESLLPQIREELGPDAVIVRQREGLIGGVGGFFQKRCVEVDARPGGPRVDVYDEEPADEADEPRVLSQEERGAAGGVVLDPSPPVPPAAASVPADAQPLVRNDAATREGLATPAVQELVDQAQPFAEVLSEMSKAPAESEEPLGPPKAEALREGLVKSGLGEDIAKGVVDAVLVSAMPFANSGRLRTLVRNELGLRIPVAPAAAPGARTVVMVGPAGAGKTTVIEAIAAAHEAQGAPVARVEAERVRPADQGHGLLLVDTPALWGGAENLGEVAAQLAALSAPEVHLVMRAGTAAAAAAELLEGLAALRPSRLLLTGAGETSHLGGVLDLAIRTGVPIGYVAEGPRELALADPRDLAGRVTP